MQYFLTPYAKPVAPFATWENAFSTEELDILQHKARLSNQDASVGMGNVGGIDKSIRRSQVNWLNSSPENVWLFERLSDICSRLNMDFFRFDLTGFGESLQLTNYDQSENGMYGWHQDYGGNGVSRKLSMTIQLSDASEYDGGNLQVMTTGEPMTMRKQRGLIVAFPSYVLHQVTPVTRGSRQSLVVWVSGPAFK
jgi:PKHD-type hydroxylase